MEYILYLILQIIKQYGGTGAIADNVYTDVAASIISYKPPDGTSRVVYEFETAISSATDTSASSRFDDYMGDFKIFIDNTEISNSRFMEGMYNTWSSSIRIKYIFEINNGTSDINNGILSSWTTNKIIKIKAKGSS